MPRKSKNENHLHIVSVKIISKLIVHCFSFKPNSKAVRNPSDYIHFMRNKSAGLPMKWIFGIVFRGRFSEIFVRIR